ncbi:DUF5331 domain-containing protein [Cronbergia sp. UHCC 0137]|uniref:DUF5331 domain-containing protein n=1 Tax=Cronbergia sp. UHCC 0137 TaxID=3110239 RepID=UPI002B217F40|nr:DUF5331 domain-containing protein [Cronbergia sp. UHCC 0137]MEA5617474.1 DUF5331 domain-containing protein [Cronbergia sp. UHCC 0137]
MDIQKLRQSLKMKWLSYYGQNRSWLVKMQIWRSFDGCRRPSSGYILATLSILEPEFEQVLSFLLDLNNNPDEIVAALGLNFNPDEELDLLESQFESQMINDCSENMDMLEQSTLNTNTNTNTLSSEESPKKQKQVLLKISREMEQEGKPIKVVAMATQVSSAPSKTVVLEKPGSRLGREARRRNDQSAIALLTSTIPQSSVSFPTPVSINYNTSPGFTKVTKNLPIKNIPNSVNISSTTNARSLPSWIDEFCQGLKPPVEN